MSRTAVYNTTNARFEPSGDSLEPLGTVYTQFYTTATAAVGAATAGTVATTAASTTTPFGYTTGAQADAIPVAINALIADVLVLRKAINAIIDDLQASGLVA